MTPSNEPEGLFSDDVLQEAAVESKEPSVEQAPPVAPPVEQAIPTPEPLPVVILQAARVPDQNDVVLDNVIVGRHSDADMRDAIAASNTPLLERVKEALAPM